MLCLISVCSVWAPCELEAREVMWRLLGLAAIASALKLLPDNEVSVDKDRKAANQVLLKVAQGGEDHLRLMLATLAADGVDLGLLQHWLEDEKAAAAAPVSWKWDEETLTESDSFRDLEVLVSAITKARASHLPLSRSVLAAMDRDRMARALRGLEALGYGQKGCGSPCDSLTSLAKSSWQLFRLVRAQREVRRDEAKQVLAEIAHSGRMEPVLSRFAALGFDYTALLRWMSDNGSFQLLLKGLEAENRSMVRSAFGELLAEGKEVLSSRLLELQGLGYDIAKVKAWYSGAESFQVAEVDAGHMVELMKQQDQEGMKRAIKDLIKQGGKVRLESALARLKALGYDPKEAERLAGGQSQPTEPKSEALVMSLKHGDRQQASQALHRILAEGGRDGLQRALAELKRQGIDPELFQEWVAEGVEALVKEKPVELVQQGRRQDMVRLLASHLREGGQRKVQQVLAKLQKEGYNSSEVQAWLYANAPLPLKHTVGA